MPQNGGICGWIKGGTQGENSKSLVWIDNRPEITLIICLLPTEMCRNQDWDLFFFTAKNEGLFDFFLDLKKMVDKKDKKQPFTYSCF